jgi:hypothetical protein
MEDVFIGMCIKKLKYRLYDIKGFHKKPKWLNPCLYRTKTFVFVHRIRSNGPERDIPFYVTLVS